MLLRIWILLFGYFIDFFVREWEVLWVFVVSLVLGIFFMFGLIGNNLNVCFVEWRRYVWII